MKLQNFENENAIELIADIIEPFSKIAQDKKLVELIKSGDKLKAVQYGLKQHKSTIIEILAILDGTPVNEYKCNVLTITKELLELLNNKELIEVFTL